MTAATTRDGEQDLPVARPEPVRAPAASRVHFLLLILTVVATGAFIFLSIYLLIPAKVQRLNATVASCTAAQEADPAFTAPVLTDEDVERAKEVSRRFQACMSPTLLDSATFVAVGLAVLFGSAIVIYRVHPWWLVRRRRLVRLADRGPGPLLEELERLRREMRLTRCPDWRLAPLARTTGGQAFGVPGHRYLQIDAGLAVLRVTDPPAFRAVVRHELAHLRNRDVDQTHMTISTWRAFVVVALVPYLALMLHPNLFLNPLGWRWEHVAFVSNPASAWYRFGSLLVLTVLVYLTRNAILRGRETHADATAAIFDQPDSALPAVVGRLPAPPWWRRWGTHPHPRRRLAAIHDPRLLLTAGFWELVGVGIATGLVCGSMGFLIGINFTVDPVLAFAVTGLVAGGLAVGLLTVAIWRTTARDPAAPPSWRTWLGNPTALVVGFLAGTFLTLRESSTVSQDLASISPTSWMVATALLLAGGVVLSAWITSAARGALERPDRPRWAMPAVVVAAVATGAVWFAVWLPTSQIDDGFADGWGAPPAVGPDIDWYTWVAAVTGAGYGPMGRLVFNPLTLFGLTLLWLVPLLVATAWCRPLSPLQPGPLRRASTATLLGFGAVVLLSVALPAVAPLAVPASVRTGSDAPGVSFEVIYENTTIALASVIVAAVMITVLVRVRSHGPALAMLAGCATTVLAAVVLSYLAEPLACHLNVGAATEAPTGCFDDATAGRLSTRAHWTMLQAILVAAPASLIVAVVRSLRRRSAPEAPTGARPVRGVVVATSAGLGLLAAVSLWLAVLTAPVAYQVWLDRAFG